MSGSCDNPNKRAAAALRLTVNFQDGRRVRCSHPTRTGSQLLARNRWRECETLSGSQHSRNSPSVQWCTRHSRYNSARSGPSHLRICHMPGARKCAADCRRNLRASPCANYQTRVNSDAPCLPTNRKCKMKGCYLLVCDSCTTRLSPTHDSEQDKRSN